MKAIFESHPVTVLKREISKTNIKGYSKMKKNEVVKLMLKNESRFKHIKMAEKKPAVKKAVKAVKKEEKKEVKKEEKKEVKKDKSSSSNAELQEKYLKKFNSLKDKNMKVYQNQFESKKKVDKDKIEEKIEKINKVIVSLEEDIKKTKSKRLERLLPSFIYMKKNYISDLK